MSKQNLIRRNPASKIREFADRLLGRIAEQRPLFSVMDCDVVREDRGMNKIAFVALGCLALGACATPTQTVGTAGGAVTGAVVGGPVGAVVGGVVGAAAT